MVNNEDRKQILITGVGKDVNPLRDIQDLLDNCEPISPPERITEWDSTDRMAFNIMQDYPIEKTLNGCRNTNLSLKQRKARKASKRARTMRKQMRRRNKK